MTLKKVGYTHKETEIEKLKQVGCEEVVVVKEPHVNTTHFLEFVEKNQEFEIVIVDFDSIEEDLTLIRLTKVLEKMTGNLTILDKGLILPISNQAYLEAIIFLGEKERNLIKKRTREGIGRSREQGRVGGRPAVSDDIIQKIKFLFLSQDMTYREIAAICDVSIGTVYKYVRQKMEPVIV